MPEPAGPTSQSGPGFQNAVESLFLGDMLDSEGKPPAETVVWVRGEAPTEVDDIVVGFADGHRAFVHCKENIEPSGTAWRGLWGDFDRQFSGSDFQPGQDRLVLYAGTTSETLRQLREICERSGGALTVEEWDRALSREQKELRDGASDCK